MRILSTISLLLIASMLAPSFAHAEGKSFINECWNKTFYFSGPTGKGSHSGLSAGNAKAIVDGDIMSIEAGTVIKSLSVIVDTAITGSTAIDIGDDDGATSFCPTASITLATPGLYCNSAKTRGAYLRVQTAGVTDAADIYVVPSWKFYQAAGKEIKLDNTTTNTAGAFRVLVEACRVGA